MRRQRDRVGRDVPARRRPGTAARRRSASRDVRPPVGGEMPLVIQVEEPRGDGGRDGDQQRAPQPRADVAAKWRASTRAVAPASIKRQLITPGLLLLPGAEGNVYHRAAATAVARLLNQVRLAQRLAVPRGPAVPGEFGVGRNPERLRSREIPYGSARGKSPTAPLAGRRAPSPCRRTGAHAIA